MFDCSVCRLDLLLIIFFATLVVSLVSFVGFLVTLFNKKIQEKMIFALVSFSAGALLGGAFLHLIPEALDKLESISVFLLVIVGFVLFFILERALRWRHCHEQKCDIHPMSNLIIVGDGIHNFVDGISIAASFLVDFNLGVLTTLLVIVHEIPQELGDFALLVYSGISRVKALLLNFVSQAFCILGGIIGFFVIKDSILPVYILSFAAGGFLYIASSDIIPELHKEKDIKKSFSSFIYLVLGIFLMLLFTFLEIKI
ncbi:MAG: ZIP family metal transporter [Candidatus Diapherotrites archaeon]|nr:ZIP family metal transporter [Candidatus Diapherotrites archaeon]